MAPTKALHLRQDIGGRFLGDPRAFLLFIPLWWGLSLASWTDTAGSHISAVSMVANAIAFSVTLGVLIVFRHTWFRQRTVKPVPLAQVVTAGAMLGTTKSLVTVTVTTWAIADLDFVELLVWRLPASSLTGAWILPVAALLLATRDRYQAQREIVVAELLRQQFMNTPTGAGLHVKDPTDVRIRAVIAEAREILAHSSAPAHDVAEKLRGLIDTQLRPLSHELWVGTLKKLTDFSVADLLRILFSHRRYWVWPTTIFVMLTNGPFVISRVGLNEGLGRATVLTFLALITLIILRATKPSGAALGLAWFLTGTFVFTTANEVTAFLLFDSFNDWSPVVSGATNAAIFAVSAIVLGVAKIARQDNRYIRSELENLLEDASWQQRLDGEHSRRRHREVAKLLHGRVQNRLLSVVLALTTHPDTRRRDDVAAELLAIENRLFGLAGVHMDDTVHSLDGALSDLAHRWAGVVTVSFTNQITDPLDPSLISVIDGAGEEAVSNAARHGLAGTVDIFVGEDGPDIIITVKDDGVGPRNGLPGLGTNYLSQISGKKWSLQPGPEGEGSVLTVRLASPPG